MESKFEGTVLEIFIFSLWMPIVCVLTLGLATPFLTCTLIRWICDKTTINGKKYKFNGTAGGLFGNWIKWFLLTIITFGIYGFWATRNQIRWVVENLQIVN